MDHRGRLANLPRAAQMSLRHREPAFLRMNVKYLLDRPFMRYLDWKTNRARQQRKRQTGTAAAT
jgi:hypothetical protein